MERDVDSVEPRYAGVIAKIHVVDYAFLRPDGGHTLPLQVGLGR